MCERASLEFLDYCYRFNFNLVSVYLNSFKKRKRSHAQDFRGVVEHAEQWFYYLNNCK